LFVQSLVDHRQEPSRDAIGVRDGVPDVMDVGIVGAADNRDTGGPSVEITGLDVACNGSNRAKDIDLQDVLPERKWNGRTISVDPYINTDLSCFRIVYEPVNDRVGKSGRTAARCPLLGFGNNGQRFCCRSLQIRKGRRALANCWVKCIQDSHHRPNLFCLPKARRASRLGVF
jgi:hypothetical protein